MDMICSLPRLYSEVVSDASRGKPFTECGLLYAAASSSHSLYKDFLSRTISWYLHKCLGILDVLRGW